MSKCIAAELITVCREYKIIATVYKKERILIISKRLKKVLRFFFPVSVSVWVHTHECRHPWCPVEG